MYLSKEIKGLIVFKKNSKYISFLRFPLDFNNNEQNIIFESKDLIKWVKVDDNNSSQILIVDEAKYLKVGSIIIHNDKVGRS